MSSQPGDRVVVRHRLPSVGPSGGPSTTDVVGRLLSIGDVLRVERRDGSVAEVPAADVVALRTVPGRPARARRAASFDDEDLERITSRGWPATESVMLGEWELRAAGAFTGRANSVAVHGDPGLPFVDAVASVLRFYAERGLDPQAQVVVGSAWERAFRDAGWLPKEGYRGGAIVQVADLGAASVSHDDVVVEPTASDAWLPLYGRVSDVAAARAVLEGPATVGFARIGAPPTAIGRVVVTGEWAGLAAVETHPDHRRRGLARRVVETSLAWAVERGATKAYLQTMPDNHPAIALYAPFGFTTHHEYRYLVPPA